MFNIVVAFVEQGGGIGFRGGLPWTSFPEDMLRFRELTCGRPQSKTNAVIMGRGTWESLPERSKPLPGRLNIIVSNSIVLHPSATTVVVSSFDDALMVCNVLHDTIHDIFVIGGGMIYNEAISHPLCSRVYATVVHGDYQTDTSFPVSELDKLYAPSLRSDKKTSKTGMQFTFCEYVRS